MPGHVLVSNGNLGSQTPATAQELDTGCGACANTTAVPAVVKRADIYSLVMRRVRHSLKSVLALGA